MAKLQAYEILNSYIQNEIDTLSGRLPPNSETGKLTWIGSEVALIELLYALDSTGAFNNGNTDLKTIVNLFQDTLQIQLGNYYSVIQQNIRIRCNIGDMLRIIQ